LYEDKESEISKGCYVKTKKVLTRIKKKKILCLWEKVIFALFGNYMKVVSRAQKFGN
jgi:hypothetical protein